jgi:hypothetical protein
LFLLFCIGRVSRAPRIEFRLTRNYEVGDVDSDAFFADGFAAGATA